MSSAHHIPFIRMNLGPSSPCRTGWSARSAAQPEWRTVTRVPVGTASNVTSTVVLSSGAKFPPRQSNRKCSGGCQAVIVPFVNVCGPDGDSNSSINRPPSRGSNRTTPGCLPAKRNLGPRPHQRSVSVVKIANAEAGSAGTVTLTVTLSEAGVIVFEYAPRGRGKQKARRPRRIPLHPASREADRKALSEAGRSALAHLPLRLPLGSSRFVEAPADDG